MSRLSVYLMTASAVVPLSLGSLHLLYTFHGPKLLPRDPTLSTRMGEVAPVITRETTVWKAWIGFNATHSLGLMLFGLVYGYLAMRHPQVLFDSRFLLGLGLLTLIVYATLAARYFFSVPLYGILVAVILYLAALVTAATYEAA